MFESTHCSSCGKVISLTEGDYTVHEDNYWCEDCYENGAVARYLVESEDESEGDRLPDRVTLKEFELIIGKRMFSAFIEMLKEIGPDARTHRMSVVIGAMLRFARDRLPGEFEDGSLAEALLRIEEEPYLASEESGESLRLQELVESLCEEAGMQNQRETSRGMPYSIAGSAIREYANWYNMPWEDRH